MRSHFSPGILRCMVIMMQRSARVSGRRPMAAMTFGHQQEYLARPERSGFGTCRSGFRVCGSWLGFSLVHSPWSVVEAPVAGFSHFRFDIFDISEWGLV